MSIDHTNQSENQDQPQAHLEQQPLHDYVIHKTLGEGNFGKVKKGIHKITGEEVAIKILEKDLIYQKTDIQRISRQIKIMKQTRHPNIIQLYEIIETSKRLYLIMEFAKNGDLFDEIVRVDQIPQQQAQQYFAQMILGLEYLHSLGITHRDLKPENLLLSGESDQIKIADFGLGNFFTNSQLLKTACGSPCYAPPQMLNKLSYDPRKVDLWSSGIILHAMVLGYLPFEDDVTSKLYQKIKTSDFKLPFRLSMPCKELIRSLLTKDPAQRITLEQVKQHQWLKSSIQNYKDMKFEIDNRIFKSVCDRFGIVEEQRLMNNLKKNKHNNLTTLYYLGQKIVKRNIDSERSADRGGMLKEDITFNNLIEDADSDGQGGGDAQLQKQMDHREKYSNQQFSQNYIKDGRIQQILKQAEAEQDSKIQNGKNKQVKSPQKRQPTSNVAPQEKEQPQAKQDTQSNIKSSKDLKTKQSDNIQKINVKDQQESNSNSKSFEAYSSTIAVKTPSKTQEKQNINTYEEHSPQGQKQEGKVSEPQDLNTSSQLMKKQKERFQQDEDFSLKQQLGKQQNSPKYKSSTLGLPELKELQDDFQSQYYREVKNSINTEQFQDEDIEPKKSPPKKVHQSPPNKANRQPPQQSVQQPPKKIPQQRPKQIRQISIKDKTLQQPSNQIGTSSLPQIRQSPPRQNKQTPPKQILAGLNKKSSIKKPSEKKVIRKQPNNVSVRQQVLNKTLPVTISKQTDKKQPLISKIPKQPTKKLIKNPRMPIHNPHINDRPTPPLYEHSQSKERPLQLKKIIAKASPVEPHLWDPKKIVLCAIDHFTTVLQQKGFGGRIDYFSFGQGMDCGIYIMKNGVTGKGLGMVIKDINSKAK